MSKKIPILFGLLFLLLYFFCLPKPLFKAPYSTVIEDSEGRLLGARIAKDGQWRFPKSDSIPSKFATALMTFEDKRFQSHWGVDVRALLRAFQQNIKAGKVVSGGSTLTMQVIRLARKDKPRTLIQKMIEVVMATRLEWRFSKTEILSLYSGHAPFGGNVVGLEAAAWRYFGKDPSQLSWGEATTLAVLPNSPALIHPGRNRAALLAKRNRLLDRLDSLQIIATNTADLAKAEPLPEKPLPLPQLAPHLLDRFAKDFSQQESYMPRLRTTIDRNLQERCLAIAKDHHRKWAGNGVHNLAILVLDIETGAVKSYVGNAPNAGAEHGQSVDIIPAARSTGSILKPFLYAQLLHHGNILPNSILPDVPTRINGYRPLNFYDTYQGVIPANEALVRSLNIPFVRALQDYGLEKFHFGLKSLGLNTINKSAEHYGLTIILGGAEASLWDITNAYTSMARSLSHFHQFDGRYDPFDYRSPHYAFAKKIEKSSKEKLSKTPVKLSAASIWQTFEVMKKVRRPNSEGDWQLFQSNKKVAWKTGTSFGFRDAWAVGIDGRYAVGVWVGNADGEGRPGLIGVKAAGPLLFDVMAQLGNADWFTTPYDELADIAVCKQSGYRATELCQTDTILAPLSGLKAKACPFHKLLYLDPLEAFQVTDQCESVANMIRRPWFVLPPLEEHYYLSVTPNYEQPPAYRSDCLSTRKRIVSNAMQFIHPKNFSEVYIPIDLNGQRSKVVFKVTHREEAATVYWHLDEEYVGKTESFHELELAPSKGEHVLTLVDGDGERLRKAFSVAN
ncbi:MAG: penicillin-binding protein 1C [Saprospiraceae bacterium]